MSNKKLLSLALASGLLFTASESFALSIDRHAEKPSSPANLALASEDQHKAQDVKPDAGKKDASEEEVGYGGGYGGFGRGYGY